MVLAAYRSPDQRDRDFERLASAAELQTLGTSVDGRPIRAARLASTKRDAPAILVCAGIHGPEYIGVESALGFLEKGAPLLRERAEVWVLPSLNPDGYARTWDKAGDGKLPALRVNAHGVDLNRNYPLPEPQRKVWITFNGWRTGSDDPLNPFYRGTGAASEPETAALVGLASRVKFHASLSLHSSMGFLFPPYLPAAPARAAYKKLCRAFARAQLHTRYKRVAFPRLDMFTGEQEDFQHHTCGTWAITVEHYPLWVDVRRFFQKNLFRRFNPPEPGHWVANDVPGMVAYFHAALDLSVVS
jgi:hypothetical protein